MPQKNHEALEPQPDDVASSPQGSEKNKTALSRSGVLLPLPDGGAQIVTPSGRKLTLTAQEMTRRGHKAVSSILQDQKEKEAAAHHDSQRAAHARQMIDINRLEADNMLAVVDSAVELARKLDPNFDQSDPKTKSDQVLAAIDLMGKAALGVQQHQLKIATLDAMQTMFDAAAEYVIRGAVTVSDGNGGVIQVNGRTRLLPEVLSPRNKELLRLVEVLHNIIIAELTAAIPLEKFEHLNKAQRLIAESRQHNTRELAITGRIQSEQHALGLLKTADAQTTAEKGRTQVLLERLTGKQNLVATKNTAALNEEIRRGTAIVDLRIKERNNLQQLRQERKNNSLKRLKEAATGVLTSLSEQFGKAFDGIKEFLFAQGEGETAKNAGVLVSASQALNKIISQTVSYLRHNFEKDIIPFSIQNVSGFVSGATAGGVLGTLGSTFLYEFILSKAVFSAQTLPLVEQALIRFLPWGVGVGCALAGTALSRYLYAKLSARFAVATATSSAESHSIATTSNRGMFNNADDVDDEEDEDATPHHGYGRGR